MDPQALQKGSRGIKAEKSETSELFTEINFTKNISLKSTAYRTRMKDRIKINSSWSGYENKILDTTQEGLESEITLKLITRYYLLILQKQN